MSNAVKNAAINVLAIDTTSEYLSLGLMKDGGIVARHYEATGAGMNRTILTVIDGMLKSAQLTTASLNLIVAARGPGSFTGTRIGLALAKSFAQVLGLPLVGVDTLRLLAAQAMPEGGGLNAEPGGLIAEPGGLIAEPGGLIAEQGRPEAGPGGLIAEQGRPEAGPGGLIAEQGRPEAGPGGLGTEQGRPETGPGGLGTEQGRPETGSGESNTEPGEVHAVLNCARDEVYHAHYRWEGAGLKAVGEIAMRRFAELPGITGDAPVVLRRFSPQQPGHEAALGRLRPAALRHAQPHAGLLLGQGLRLYQAGAPYAPAEPIYLKSEAFRKWNP